VPHGRRQRVDDRWIGSSSYTSIVKPFLGAQALVNRENVRCAVPCSPTKTTRRRAQRSCRPLAQQVFQL
jgi:hypothetical protein